jgi:sarcosine oxidase subunit gamma
MPEILDHYAGFAEVSRLSPPGMVAVKADLADPDLPAALDIPVPGVRRWEDGAGGRALWMAPDELLLVVPDAAAAVDRIAGRLAGRHATLADASGLRVAFSLRGAGARDVLAKLMPVDFSDFPPGTLRRSRAAQVAALVWADADGFGLMTARSVADYAWALLTTAARPGGEVGLYR